MSAWRRRIPAGLIVAIALVSLMASAVRAQQREGRSDPRRRELDVQAEMARAERFMREKRYDEAIAVLEAVCRDFPEIVYAPERLSEAYLRAGRPQRAVALLEERLARNQTNINIIKNLGLAYLDLGEKEKAVGAWHRILTGDKRQAPYYGIVAKLEQEAGLYERALETLREGRRFKRYFQRYTMDIVRLERIRGNHEAAFGEGLLLLSKDTRPTLQKAKFTLEIFRESGIGERLLAMVDSVAAASGGHGPFFALLRAVLLVDAGEYEAAAAYLESGPPAANPDSTSGSAKPDSASEPAGDPVSSTTTRRDPARTAAGAGAVRTAPSEQDHYAFINAIASLRGREPDDAFDAFFERTLDLFIERHPQSPVAPAVFLATAEYRRQSANRSVPPDSNLLAEAIVLAQRARHHGGGVPFRDRAAVFKARIELEDFHRPGKALLTLDAAGRWRTESMQEVEELRLHALLASGDWGKAARHFERLSGSRDSTLAVIGRYGTGMTHFYRGEYGEAVAELSDLAEKQAQSRWANDALDYAILIKSAMEEGTEALDLYRKALLAEMKGDIDGAARLLGQLGASFEGTVPAPRAALMRAELLVRAGRTDEAETGLVHMAEHYPLHELAPRALERLGDLAGTGRPAEAAAHYGTIIERYPDDPFIERVRNKYIAAEKASGEGTPGTEPPDAGAPDGETSDEETPGTETPDGKK